jgi:hypothetical protein
MTSFFDTLAFERRVVLWISIFVLMLVLDWIWAKYNQATVKREAWRASAYAVLIYAFGAAGVLSYSNDPTLIIPACAGAFVGTFLATRQTKVA